VLRRAAGWGITYGPGGHLQKGKETSADLGPEDKHPEPSVTGRLGKGWGGTHLPRRRGWSNRVIGRRPGPAC